MADVALWTYLHIATYFLEDSISVLMYVLIAHEKHMKKSQARHGDVSHMGSQSKRIEGSKTARATY